MGLDLWVMNQIISFVVWMFSIEYSPIF